MNDNDDISDDQLKIVDGLLLEAVSARAYERIDLCLQKGADINARNADGRTPLMMAVWKDDPQLVKFILQKNPALFLKDNSARNAFDLIAKVSDQTMRERITDIMLRALPNHVRSRVTGPGDVAAAAQELAAGQDAARGEEAPANPDIETKSDVSLSKPVVFAPKRKPGGLSL